MTIFQTSTLAFATYWSTPILARDFAVLVRCGGVQALARDGGHDTPAGWFRQAARSYWPADASDPQGVMARRALEGVAAAFEQGGPS